MHKDKRTRSILKAVTYRLLSIMLDSTIAYLITKSTTQTVLLVVISNMISIIMYFVHERAWNRVSWGKHFVDICLRRTGTPN